jgi:hypothetical protein
MIVLHLAILVLRKQETKIKIVFAKINIGRMKPINRKNAISAYSLVKLAKMKKNA